MQHSPSAAPRPCRRWTVVPALVLLCLAAALLPGRPAAAVAPRGSQQDLEGVIREPRALEEFEHARDAAMSDCPPPPTVDGVPKSEWPELQGKPAAEAQALLEQQAPGFRIQVINHDQMATMDWRCDRIRIWLDENERVVRPPRIG